MQNIDDLNIKIEEEKESSFHRFEIELKADIDRTEIRYQRFKKDLPKEFHSYLEPYEKLLRKLQSERESWAEARENLDDDAKNEIIRDFLAKNPEI
ncbi:hypothetical protein N836_23130 [Leptolyngbya sp. Heron Island J]|nr:hypothetical protein N836_23130 [Leptolyngbya sp. Heron Island J]